MTPPHKEVTQPLEPVISPQKGVTPPQDRVIPLQDRVADTLKRVSPPQERATNGRNLLISSILRPRAYQWISSICHRYGQPDGVVELDFSKEGSDGVNIYCQREGDANFVFLARDTSSPYVDNRPLMVAGKPEVRRYRCRYILGDQEIGLPSDEIVVTAQPY